MSTRPIVFLDTEQDGLHPGRKVWEVAMIRREVLDEASAIAAQKETTFFVALDLRNSDPAGLAVGRFFERHPSGRKLAGLPQLPGPAGIAPVYSGHDAAKTIMQWTYGATIVGAVPSFDTETLARLLRAEGYQPTWHHRLRCVETLTAGFLGRDPGGLRDCAEARGVPHDDLSLHTALGDARLAMRIYDEVMSGDESDSAATRSAVSA